jgi:hypothetical protein
MFRVFIIYRRGASPSGDRLRYVTRARYMGSTRVEYETRARGKPGRTVSAARGVFYAPRIYHLSARCVAFG